MNIDWQNVDQAKKLLARKNKPAALRLAPKPDDYYGQMRILDTRSVILVSSDPHLLDPKAVTEVKPKADETPDEAAERAQAAEKARLEAEAEERRAERAAMRRAEHDMAWLVFNLADLLAVQIKVEPLGTLEALMESHQMTTHNPSTPWPQYNVAYDTLDDAAKEAKSEQKLLLLRKRMIARELGSRMSGYSPKEQFNWDSALEDAKFVADEWGLKLPKGWNTPPIHRTDSNCHVCGRFTSMDHVTKRDQEEGWQVQGDTVTCSNECRANLPAAGKKKVARKR